MNQAYNIILHSDISGFNNEFLKISVDNLNKFMIIAQDSDANMLMLNDTSTALIAYYNDFSSFPVSRVYTYLFKTYEELNNTLIEIKKLKLDFSIKNHDELIDKLNAHNRIKEYKINKAKRYSKINKFTEGRINNTAHKGGVIIVTEDDKCSLCNSDLTDNIEIEEISFISGDINIQFTMEVCKDCVSKNIENNQLLDSIFQVSNIEKILENRELSIEEIRILSNSIVKYYLKYNIEEKANKENDTITATTKSGYILKLRLTKIEDYGYSILSQDNVELVRFDCAPDHPDKVEFMPHHIHKDLVQENLIDKEIKKAKNNKKKRQRLKKSKNITDSFLTGYLGLDYVSIKNVISILESNKDKLI